MQAVATETAPSTPIDSCTRCGMKVRVETRPPSRAGARMLILGTVLLVTSPRFISGPTARRMRFDPLPQLGVGLELGRGLVAGDAEVGRREADHGHPVVDAGDLDALDDVDRRCPWAAARRRLEPATSSKLIMIGRVRSGNPVDAGVARVVHDAAGRLRRTRSPSSRC